MKKPIQIPAWQKDMARKTWAMDQIYDTAMRIANRPDLPDKVKAQYLEMAQNSILRVLDE